MKLPKHLWRSVLDNVPRANFPRSVLNGHALAWPAPAAARWPIERGRGVRIAIEAQSFYYVEVPSCTGQLFNVVHNL